MRQFIGTDCSARRDMVHYFLVSKQQGACGVGSTIGVS